MQSIGDAVIATDPDGLITFMNPPAEKLTGWPLRDAAGMPLAQVFRILHEETRAPLESPVDRVLREGHVVALGNHTLLLRRDGSEIPIDDSAAPIRNEQGELNGVVLVFRDVTEKKRAEEAIADLLKREKAARAEAEIERQKLYSVFMQAPVAICILEGPQHTFVFANPAYRALVGDRDLVGKPLLEALPDIRGQGFDTLLDRVVATGEPFFGGEIPARLSHHGPGESLIMNFFYSPKRDVSGAIDGVLVSVIDVTEQVRARERLQALADRLRDSEERLRRVVDASGTGTWEVDLGSDRMTGDAQHLALMGLPPSTTLTRNVSVAATHPDDRALLAQAFTAAVAGENGGRFFIEHRVAGSNPAAWRWVEGRGQLLPSSDGTPGRLVGTTVDVTERKRTERALADERDKLQTIFQESPAAMALWRGPELVFEKVNPTYQAIFGDRELMGKPLAEAIPELAGQPFGAQLLHVLSTGEPLVGREVLARLAPRRDGELEDHFFDFTYVRINDSHGRPYGVYDHAMDVTDRVLARRELEASQERLQLALANFRTLAEAIPQQVWTALPTGELDFVNQRVATYFGSSAPRILGAGWQELIHPDDVDECVARWIRSLATGESYEVEFRLRDVNGDYRWHLGRATAARDPQGGIIKWFGTNTDVDEAKRFREELLQSRAVEQRLRQEAEEANRSKDEFLAMLGHELRNPLAPIATALQLMKLRADDSFARERVLIERQVDHLTRLVDDLLDVSRITRGKVEINRERVDLAAVVAGAIEMASPLIEQRQHQLIVEPVAAGADRRRRCAAAGAGRVEPAHQRRQVHRARRAHRAERGARGRRGRAARARQRHRHRARDAAARVRPVRAGAAVARSRARRARARPGHRAHAPGAARRQR